MVPNIMTFMRSEGSVRYFLLPFFHPSSSFSPSLLEKGQAFWQMHIERGEKERVLVKGVRAHEYVVVCMRVYAECGYI